VNPEKWRKCAVMTNQWRLIDGKELYDMSADSGQAKDVSVQYPEVVQRLRSDYEAFWSDVSSEHDLTSHSIIGSNEAPVVTLTSHDWLVENIPWYQPHVMQGAFVKPGHWAVEVAEAGDYEISLRRWPVEADAAINSGKYGKAFNFTEARLRVADIDTRMPIPTGAKEVTFKVKLAAGITTLAPLFVGNEIETAPFYAYVARSPKLGWNTAEAMGIPHYDPAYGAVPPQVKDQDRVNYNRQKKKK
jgi:arylsulfatase B